MDNDKLWPSQGDKLFVEDGLLETTAYIMRTNVLTAISIAEGYARVAEIAVTNCDREELNRIVYPVIFCYRHAVEVYLKFARTVARRLFQIPVDSTKRMDHGLWEIWLELRPLIERCWPKDPFEDLQATEAMIKEFDQVDRNAQRFRFPTANKSGVPHFPSDMNIDLVNFCHSGRKILGFLQGCSDGMYETIYAQGP